MIDTLNSEYSKAMKISNLNEVLVEVGPPAQVIMEQSKLRNSDLLVLGSHGQQAYSGGVMGSVVTKVLQITTVPIYMIPMVNLEDIDRY